MHFGKRLSALAAVALALSGCASIVDGSTQVISVKAVQGGTDIIGANCSLTNNKGAWFATTPGTTSVHRSIEDLAVKCSKDGFDPGLQTVQSSTKGMAFGNILFGGIIGAGTDIATGAAYDYPQLVTVPMVPTTVPVTPVASAASAPTS